MRYYYSSHNINVQYALLPFINGNALELYDVKIIILKYPYPCFYNSCDSETKDKDYFPIRFMHPSNCDGEVYSLHNKPGKGRCFLIEKNVDR